MRTIVRSLMLWLLLLAVPFQGIASAARLPCADLAPVHAQAKAAAPGAIDHAAMGHTAHNAAAKHNDAGGSGASHHADAKCGACCLGAAMAPPVLRTPALQAQSNAIEFDARHLPSVHPALPERPPRSSRA